MKTSGMIVLSCLLLLSLASFKQMEKQPQVTITPERLHLFVNQHTDPYTIKVDYTVNIPANYISSCAQLVFQPYFAAAGEKYALTPLIISGKKYLRRQKRLRASMPWQAGREDVLDLISEGEGMKIRLSAIVPFQLWMVQSKLQAQVSLESCHRKKETYQLTLAEGMFYMPLAPGPIRLEYKKEKVAVQKSYSTDFFYPEGQFTFNKNYDRNARHMQEINRLLDSLRQDTSMQLIRIVLTGSSSPLGAPQTNQRLSQQRAEQLKQYLIQAQRISGKQIEIKTTGENWKDLHHLVEQSSLPDKEAVLKILNSKLTETEKQNRLRQLPQYPYLRQNLFPQLRKVTCRIDYTQQEEKIRVIPL